jgi:putative iron-dependent peroxidase
VTSEIFSQPGILEPSLACGRSLGFRFRPGGDAHAALRRLRDGFDVAWGVLGLGEPLTRLLGRSPPGLRSFQAVAGVGCAAPSTQQALWLFLRAPERGILFDRSEAVIAQLEPGFVLDDAIDTFRYRDGRDLSGYLDGTENPTGDKSIEAAIVASGAGLRGSSFVAVQRWEHDLPRFRAHSGVARDAMIGRRLTDNEEIEDAPPSAHVKRSAQEDYDPPAFMVRRSMPWSSAPANGLEFIAYGKSLDAFEQVMRRMAGLDDGIVDALFSFSRPITGGCYWCPPIAAKRLDLAHLGL